MRFQKIVHILNLLTLITLVCILLSSWIKGQDGEMGAQLFNIIMLVAVMYFGCLEWYLISSMRKKTTSNSAIIVQTVFFFVPFALVILFSLL